MTESRADAAESWLWTSDAVLRGLNHEFSNRVSLARLAPQLLAMAEAGDRDMQRIAAAEGQSDDMLQLLRLYRLLVFHTNEPAEPIIIADVLDDAVSLFNHHTIFRDIEIRVTPDATIPPVLLDPASLTQALLLLFCAAAELIGGAQGEGGVIELGYFATPDDVRVSAAVPVTGAAAPATEPPQLPALRYLIRDADGRVEVAPDGVTMTLGSLLKLRRREKEG